MQFTGQALVTFAITAAVVDYNLTELEDWFTRASRHCPDNPLLQLYREHPLHQPTHWQYGYSMRTKQEADSDEHALIEGYSPPRARSRKPPS